MLPSWHLSQGAVEHMTVDGSFHCEIENLKDKDEKGNRVTTVKCHGKLVGEKVSEIKELVKPLITAGGRIVIDVSDLNYLDSAGLGALVGLKVSAIRQGYCSLELINMTPRVLELLRVTHLAQMFSS
jgi:anti-anti-sigma factor